MSCGGCKSNKPADKLKSIYDGWKHLIWPDAETERIAKERAVMCADCKHSKLSWCNQCGCYIPAKIRSLNEKCPIAKW